MVQIFLFEVLEVSCILSNVRTVLRLCIPNYLSVSERNYYYVIRSQRKRSGSG
jgi:hypothetical protein